MEKKNQKSLQGFELRKMITIAVASAMSVILMLLQINLPIAPDFIKLDFGDLPALVISFTFGPLAGAATCLVKNLLHLFMSSTSGIGELSNFILGCAFVIPAGLIYKKKKSRKNALLGMVVGTVAFALMGIFSNYYIIFPFYTKVMGIPMDAIIKMCQEIIPFIDSELKAILLSVTPCNIIKCTAVSLVTFLIYKRLSPLLKGNKI